MRYLLDTNVLSEMMKNPQGVVARKIAEVGENSVCTSLLAVAEVRYGIEKSGSKRLAFALSAILRFLKAEAWDTPAELRYASLRVLIEKAGRPSGQLDMLLAAHALALGAVFVTANERHFTQVPGLKVENWLRES
jgi:tRNA(fMet)-specific endonuclease VapC